ncbi:hypothetical protein SAMN05216464_11940 [Mucilaginibacter pineti]|uniref:Glycoside hydrolase 123-like N-terminal domain-containing protein n=1 Tax=Mucilaginibacter pineti TaxID=1391627 RepID=A0A1G7LMQ5_9SPHI|nr:glycoside hydrolase domain-containing protein [Mucilaginibacter pineti]SDF50654.1 hypothetical protein SAMN05216464_11940 [Mucilaginibacter pineti]
MKISSVTIILSLLTTTALAQGISYEVSKSPWTDTLGNHRAVIKVDKNADAVEIKIDWRRRDIDADKKAIIITDEAGKPVVNIYRVNINREQGDLVFQPNKGAGKYFVYYYPWHGKKYDGGFEGDYLKKETLPNGDWVQKNKLSVKAPHNLQQAKLLQIESRTSFDSFYPMEVVAKKQEADNLISQSNSPYLVFPEDRKYPIKMFDDLPYKWIKTGTSNSFQGSALRNEYYVFQLGVFASKQALKNVKIEYINAPYPATCFNTEGNDSKGKYFTKIINIQQGKVQPFWIGLDIPENAKPGIKEFQVKVTPENAPAHIVTVKINIQNETIVNRGDDELWRYSRLRWLNSTMGINDKNTSNYTALQINNREIRSKMAAVVLNDEGMPGAISVHNKQILQSPISFAVETDKGIMQLRAGKVTFTKKASGVVEWTSTSENDSLKINYTGSMESDGYLHYSLNVRPKINLQVKDIHLNLPINKNDAKYFMGMGSGAELTPVKYDWKWKGPYDSYWIGDYDAGIYCKLLGATYSGPMLNLYHPAPPPSWYNNNAGGFRIGSDNAAVNTQAFTGERALKKDSSLQFEFSLLITPFKEVDTKKQFTERYYQSYMGIPAPPQSAVDAGIKIVNVHHANRINPYINYPFIRADSIRAFADYWHKKGIKTKIYYTIRELSNQAAEIWALRSLGTEIYADGDGGGYLWLREHLIKHYDVQWFTPIIGYEACDAAILTSGDSRWFNYYIEGLNWILRKTNIDGLYLDDVSYDRAMLKRMRKVMENVKPDCVIDLHSNTGFSIGPAAKYTDFFPYINKLWFGESFMYNKMSPANWMVETSGIPFGLTGDMLFQCGNAWRGMLYGMSSRLGWSTDGIICDPRPLWKTWDEFGVADAKMIGYWQQDKVVTTSNPDVLATAYVKNGHMLIAIASWAKNTAQVTINIDWKKLGWVPKTAVLTAKAIDNFQSANTYKLTDQITIDPTKGCLLEVN